jgi:hypothetical protein
MPEQVVKTPDVVLTTELPDGAFGVLVTHRGGPTVVMNQNVPEDERQAVIGRLLEQQRAAQQ